MINPMNISQPPILLGTKKFLKNSLRTHPIDDISKATDAIFIFFLLYLSFFSCTASYRASHLLLMASSFSLIPLASSMLDCPMMSFPVVFILFKVV